MKYIILILSLFLLSGCSQRTATCIKTHTETRIELPLNFKTEYLNIPMGDAKVKTIEVCDEWEFKEENYDH